MRYLEEDVRLVAEQPYNWDKLSNKTIMISGGTGFIGSFITAVLRYRNEKHHQGIKVISLSRRGGISDDTVEHVSCDITDVIRYDERVDYILHLASNTHPEQYEKDPVGTITTNVLGCHNLLQYAVKNETGRFLLASSVEIYGQGKEMPVTETYCGYIDCNNARSGYNEAKRTCEALCQSYKKQYGVDVVIARLSRVFGPDPKKDTKALAQFMRNAVSGEDIVLKSKGLQRYSYCYVADAASAILFLLMEGESGEAYNVSDEDEGMTLGGYAEFIAQLAREKAIYKLENNDSVSKATYALLDIEKIKRLGWKPLRSVREALERTFLIYMQQHEPGTLESL